MNLVKYDENFALHLITAVVMCENYRARCGGFTCVVWRAIVTAGDHRGAVGSCRKELGGRVLAAAFSMAWPAGAGPGWSKEQACGILAAFREVYRCLVRRRDALSKLADAVLFPPTRRPRSTGR